MVMKKFHDLTAVTITGNTFHFSDLQGKKVLIVNTASECGNTPQYKNLQELYIEFHPSGFEIVAFPSNDFGNQEPGDDDAIAEFCEMNFGVTFPLMKKTKVTGTDAHEVYRWLTRKTANGIADVELTWNFQKFAVDENGILVKSFAPNLDPLDFRIIDWIQNPKLF